MKEYKCSAAINLPENGRVGQDGKRKFHQSFRCSFHLGLGTCGEPLFRAREPGPGQNALSLVFDSKSRTMTSLCTSLSHYPLAVEL